MKVPAKRKMQMAALAMTFLSGAVASAQQQENGRVDLIGKCKSTWESLGCTVPERPEPGSHVRPSREAMQALRVCIEANDSQIADVDCQSLPEPPHRGGPKGPPPQHQAASKGGNR